jgi:thymidine kinase
VIDEVQFMSTKGMGEVLLEYLHQGARILLAGLLASTELEPFPSTQLAMVLATKIIHCTAYCEICGLEAAFGICKDKKDGAVLVGEEPYRPRCFAHLERDNPNYSALVLNVEEGE